MERNNRTWICSVLFLDIVGYSTLTVSDQMEVKQHFSSLITDSLRDVPQDDCIKLDTGDGVAICYLGDPEEIFFIGIGLRDAFINLQDSGEETVYKVKLGINLGPVKIVEDINGHRNTIGDGINVAQRVMTFAKDNQLLVSRSFYNVVSCMSDEYQNMFHYLGRHADKHVRKHALYEVVSKGEGESGGNPDVRFEPVYEDESETEEQQPDSAPGFDPVILANFEKNLAEYVGPMAGILTQKAAKQAHSLDELRRLLAEEIPEEDERHQFLTS